MMNDKIQETTGQSYDPVKQTPNDFVKMRVLHREDYLSECVFFYNQQVNKGNNPGIYQIKTALSSLFDEVKFSMYEEMKKEDYDNLFKLTLSNKEDDIFEARNIISSWLHKIQLTSIFKRKIL
jgi:hypothetical protein